MFQAILIHSVAVSAPAAWDDSSPLDDEPPPRLHWQMRVLLAIVGACGLAYLGYILAFGVNAIFGDEWAWALFLVPGQMTLQAFWAQHNESIFFFPNLVAVVLMRLTSWNDFAFYGLSAAFMLGALAVVLKVFWTDIKRSPLWWIPVPFLVLTLVQYENTLWAFQIAWAMVLFAVVASVAVLCRSPTSILRLILAAALGILASYSLLQGLCVWPCGLAVLLTRGQPKKMAAIWCALAALVTFGYFADFSLAASGSPTRQFILAHLTEGARGFLITMGSVIPNINSGIPPIASPSITEAVGALLLISGAVVVIAWFTKGRPSGARAFCVALILLTVLFDLVLIPGRLVFSANEGTISRYATFNWPLVLGVYGYAVMWWSDRPKHKIVALVARFGLTSLVLAQIAVGSIVGFEQGQITRTVRLTSQAALANWQTEPPAIEAPYLYPPCGDDPHICVEIYNVAQTVQQAHMNLFADPATVTKLQSLGIVPGGTDAVQLPVPAYLQAAVGSTPHGQQAWNVLGSIYTSDRALQASYPQTKAGTQALLAWAAAAGKSVTPSEISKQEWSAPVTSDLFLLQYATTYAAWAKALQ